jgi:TRAP-type mannitol/chloroaromatic compound transport system permease small subunit
LKILENLNIWIGRLSSYLIFIIVAIMAYEVIARYFFHMPTVWINEMSGYLFGAIVFLAGGYAYSKEAHVKVDVIYNRWSMKTRRIADFITTIIIIGFCSLMIVYGTQGAIESIASLQTSGTMWNPPYWPMKVLVPVGFALILLRAVRNLASIIAKFRDSR